MIIIMRITMILITIITIIIIMITLVIIIIVRIISCSSILGGHYPVAAHCLGPRAVRMTPTASWRRGRVMDDIHFEVVTKSSIMVIIVVNHGGKLTNKWLVMAD